MTHQHKKRRISAEKNAFFPDWKEIVRYKDLLLTLTWRDFKVRYAQTSIGLLWAILQPVITVVILTVVFGSFIGVKSAFPPAIITLSGMSMWTYFSYVLMNSGTSIIASQNMIQKVYFPRILIPISKALVGLIDLLIVFVIFAVMMMYYGITPSSNIWLAPLFVFAGIISALSFGIWLSALTVRYRDFQHIVPFIVQIGLYITPVAYPIKYATEHLPDWGVKLYYLNPVVGIIEGFRWSVLGGEAPNNMIYISFAVVVLVFTSGLVYFNKIEHKMADFV